MKPLLLPAGLAPFLVACASPGDDPTPTIPGPAGSVTRSEALAIVATYVKTSWMGEARHRFHGHDSRDIPVRTPDAHRGGGYWKIDHVNYGVPYKWGGFDTPRSFMAGLKKGKYAGDISSPYKRKFLHAAISEDAVGIDCSGLISRAWRLDRPYSTRELPEICDRLESWHDLKPGDILNRYNHHVVMFTGWKKRGELIYGCEAGPVSGWRACGSVVEVDYLKELDYQALRYRNMRDDPVNPGEGSPSTGP